MYRVVCLNGQFYATEIGTSLSSIVKIGDKSIIEDIDNFVLETDPVILVDNLEDLENIGIDSEKVQIVNEG